MFDKTLTHYRERFGIKKVDLARKIDVSLTYIASIESGKQKPPTRETCAKIAKALRLNEQETSELMGLAVMERMKASDLATIKSSLAKGRTLPPPMPAGEKPKKAPIMPWALANKKITEDDIPAGLEVVMAETASRHNTFALRIENTSMSPELQPGDIVIIDECPSPKDGDLVLACDHKGHTPIIRQYKDYGRTRILHPLNTELKDIVLGNDKRYAITGKVVERVVQSKKY